MSDGSEVVSTTSELASYLIDQLAARCIQSGLKESRDDSVLIESMRIVASNLVISKWTGRVLSDVMESPEAGIRETSSRVGEDKEEEVWSTVRLIAGTLEEQALFRDSRDISPYEFARILEEIHAITVYGDITLTATGVQSNGSLTVKRIHGAFYTPPTIARFICEGTIGAAYDSTLQNIEDGKDPPEALVRLMRMRILDPACGPGTFLIEALQCIEARYGRIREVFERFRESGDNKIDCADELDRWLLTLDTYKDHQLTLIYGVDIDSAATEIAAVSLAAFLSEPRESLKTLLGDTIKVGNSLISEFAPRLVEPSGKELSSLLELRDGIRRAATVAKKESLNREYRAAVREIEQGAFMSVEGRRASGILSDDILEPGFCWELEFPEAYFALDASSNPGFSFVVMNPPYDILKLNQSEFVRRGMSEKEKAEALQEFERLKETERNLVRFFRESGQYEWSVDNVINLYRLMIERAVRVSSPTAKLGFIVPSTLLCDSSSTKLRKKLLQDYTILGIDEFDEKANLFIGVTQAVCIVRLDKAQPSSNVPIAVHGTNSVDALGCHYDNLSLDAIESISGSSLTIPKVSHESWSILKKIHEHPRVVDTHWIVNRRGELDLTAYRRFITYDDTGTKLVRGNHIKRYGVAWNCNSKECYVKAEEFLDALGQSAKVEHVSMKRIAGQQVCNMAQKWRLKFGIVPHGAVLANSCNYLIAQGTEDDERSLLYLLALMNSHVLNWRFKATSTNNHVNNNEIDMLPIPDVSVTAKDRPEILRQICDNVEKMNKELVDDLEQETEALVFHLYDLSEQEALTILENQAATSPEREGILQFLAKLNHEN